MKKTPFSLIAVLMVGALAGCINVQPTTVTTAVPVRFPYPGVYTGSVKGGSLTYRIHADGHGLSCVRNQFTGHISLGDVTYDGTRLHTEDGTFEVAALQDDEITLKAPSLRAVLRKVDEAPTICREFFKN